MQDFINIALSLPTVVWTVLLGITVLYWGAAILGALDLEVLDVELDLDVEQDLDLDLDLDLDAGDAAGGEGSGILVRALSALGVGQVPVTVLLSFVVLVAWSLSYAATAYAEGPLGLGRGLFAAVVLAGSLVVAIPVAGLLAHPLKGIFKIHTKHGGAALVGEVCVVTMGPVTASTGQARLDDGRAGLLLSVRYDGRDGLGKGERALIVDYEAQTQIYRIEPLESLLGFEPDGPEGAVERESMGGAREHARQDMVSEQ